MSAHNAVACSLKKPLQWTSYLLLGCMSLAIAADKVAELSDDFLEYLGSMESDEESWVDFKAEVVAVQATSSSSAASSVTTRVTPEAGKVDK